MSTYLEESKKADSFETVQDTEKYQIKVGDRLVLKEKFDPVGVDVWIQKLIVKVASGTPVVVTVIDPSYGIVISDINMKIEEFKEVFNVIPAHYYGLVEEL